MKALSAILAALCAIGTSLPAAAQSCSAPIAASLGDTPFSTTPGAVVSLTSAPAACDVSEFGSNIMFNVTWLRFVPQAPGDHRFETCGLVNFDSRLAVMRDCEVPSTCLGGDDDSAGCTLASSSVAWASRVLVPASEIVVGQPIMIGIGTFTSNANGSGALRIVNAGSPDDGRTCGSALPAAGSPGAGTATGFSNADATESVSVPTQCSFGIDGDQTIYRARWFRFTPSADTVAEVSTCPELPGEAGFDTRIAVFEACGTSGSGDVVVACNDDAPGCASFGSAARFNAAAGVTYRIAVGGRSPSSAGAGVLRIRTEMPPPPACGTAAHDCCEPSEEPYCSDGDCCAVVCAEDPYCCSSDGAWDAFCADRARVLCSGCGAGQCEIGTPDAIEPEPCGTGTSLNAGCEQDPPAFEPLAAGARVLGTFWAQDGVRDTDWYEFSLTAPATVTLSLRSKGPGQLFLVDDSCPPAIIDRTSEFEPSCPAVLADCLTPGTYRVIVAMSAFEGFPCGGDRNEYSLELETSPCDAEVPSNDECATAQPIPEGGAAIAIDTRLATSSEGALPAPCDEGSGVTIVRDVWFAWTPPAGRIARVATCDGNSGGPGFDTRIAAYAGCGGPVVACNDDSSECTAFRSVMTFPADGTTTYLIRVGGFDSSGQGYVWFDALAPLTNDECATAVPISDGVLTATTRLATDSAPALPPLDCDEGFGTAIRKDVWFRYVASCTGSVTVSTCVASGSESGAPGFDTWLAAYDSCNGTLLACNDDTPGCALLTSRIQFAADQGSTYLIRLGGHDASGEAVLSVTCSATPPPPVPGETCGDPIALSAGEQGAVTFDNTSAASDPPTTPSGGCAGSMFERDVWLEYRPVRGGLTTFSLCGATAFDSRLELWTGCPGSGSASVVACNDDFCGGQSSLSFVVPCEVPSYLVRVGSFSPGTYGPGRIVVTEGAVDCANACRADINGDGLVDGFDLADLLATWGQGRGAADLDGNGLVNGADLGLLIQGWGRCPG